LGSFAIENSSNAQKFKELIDANTLQFPTEIFSVELTFVEHVRSSLNYVAIEPIYIPFLASPDYRGLGTPAADMLGDFPARRNADNVRSKTQRVGSVNGAQSASGRNGKSKQRSTVNGSETKTVNSSERKTKSNTTNSMKSSKKKKSNSLKNSDATATPTFPSEYHILLKLQVLEPIPQIFDVGVSFSDRLGNA
jgi:hypothetical protein